MQLEREYKSLDTFSQYVGIPFLEGGQTREAIDCYGIFVLVYRELWNIELPAFSELFSSPLDQKSINAQIHGHLENWHPIQLEEARQGDGLIMYVGREPTHLALVIGNHRILHAEKNCASCIEDYLSMKYEKRIEGAYRYMPT